MKMAERTTVWYENYTDEERPTWLEYRLSELTEQENDMPTATEQEKSYWTECDPFQGSPEEDQEQEIVNQCCCGYELSPLQSICPYCGQE